MQVCSSLRVNEKKHVLSKRYFSEYIVYLPKGSKKNVCHLSRFIDNTVQIDGICFASLRPGIVHVVTDGRFQAKTTATVRNPRDWKNHSKCSTVYGDIFFTAHDKASVWCGAQGHSRLKLSAIWQSTSPTTSLAFAATLSKLRSFVQKLPA